MSRLFSSIRLFIARRLAPIAPATVTVIVMGGLPITEALVIHVGIDMFDPFFETSDLF